MFTEKKLVDTVFFTAARPTKSFSWEGRDYVSLLSNSYGTNKVVGCLSRIVFYALTSRGRPYLSVQDLVAKVSRDSEKATIELLFANSHLWLPALLVRYFLLTHGWNKFICSYLFICLFVRLF